MEGAQLHMPQNGVVDFGTTLLFAMESKCLDCQSPARPHMFFAIPQSCPNAIFATRPVPTKCDFCPPPGPGKSVVFMKRSPEMMVWEWLVGSQLAG